MECAAADTLPSGETFVIYEFVASRPLDFFAASRFDYVGFELGMNAEFLAISIHAGEQASDPVCGEFFVTRRPEAES